MVIKFRKYIISRGWRCKCVQGRSSSELLGAVMEKQMLTLCIYLMECFNSSRISCSCKAYLPPTLPRLSTCTVLYGVCFQDFHPCWSFQHRRFFGKLFLLLLLVNRFLYSTCMEKPHSQTSVHTLCIKYRLFHNFHVVKLFNMISLQVFYIPSK